MRLTLILLAAGVCLAASAVLVYFRFFQEKDGLPPRKDKTNADNTYEVEYTDYKPPADADDGLTDDRIEDKHPAFDAAVVDRRRLGQDGAWMLNASAAVIRLDVPLIKPDVEGALLTLYPSYGEIIRNNSAAMLPSVNALDGKAKQFDDGLYAALDRAYYQGLDRKLPSHVQLVKRLADRAGKDNPATPYLAAGLELAGLTVPVADTAARDRFLSAFRANEVASKPTGFYTWNEQLATLFRFLRFFQHEFGDDPRDLTLVQALAAVLGQDPALLADYQRAVAFYSKLSNPSICLSLADVRTAKPLDAGALQRLAREKQRSHSTVAFFPPSTSKEVVLFEKLFPLGVPPNVELMKELVRRIRSGEVDLKPGPASGWYDYQVYALETLLLPEKGQEKDKLLLTKAYKKRMLEAFKALVTKRRETHVRQLAGAKDKAAAPPPKLEEKVRPRLRVEPSLTYYLRTARAYAFLANFLEATVGKEGLQRLHGLKQDGERSADLYSELTGMRDLFYGLYLVGAEDIGQKPALAADEGVDPEHCYKLATSWLPKAFSDPDLAVDTRVAVPIYLNRDLGLTRLWVTLGVRLTRLETSYVRPPSLKPANGAGEWKPADWHQLQGASYLIPVDEFAEVELKGNRVLSREELRAICDREKTKEAILEALRR
jgi:hypothetical protein